ncbi:MAG: molybdenum cofactor biosynthesis protein [Elusimicrobia bacterium]|nr:MAG: molybdenum cofactor biosynthesis protein [Elusimicrobiota bacterium]KAF0157885.1 MAG: molybdenum cofactor biosynthesis protein [Elusimicrobiota bacterium]
MGIDYLRLSLTDRCNLNCVYCTPLEKRGFLRHEDLLRHEEITRAVAAFVKAGVRKVRLTGGEPLVRKNIVGLVEMLRAIPGLEELALTTNGLLLEELAAPLREAGLDRVNISLDSLKKETFEKITGSVSFDKVWRGVEAALEMWPRGVKLNVVLMRRLNDAEAADFARLTLDRPLSVRFIEFYATNARAARLGDALVPTAATRRRIEDALGPLEAVAPSQADGLGRHSPQSVPGPGDIAPGTCGAGGSLFRALRPAGPARVYKLRGAKGRIGFISGRSDYFCGACNRVRMDCAGKVYPCLFAGATHDLRDLLRRGAPEEALYSYIKKVFLVKSNHRKDTPGSGHIEMSSIGG